MVTLQLSTRLVAVALAVAVLAACVATAGGAPRAPWVRVPKAAVDETQMLKMVVGLRRRNMEQLDKIFWEVSDPSDARYGEHLSNAEMRHLVAPGRDAMRAVLQWLSGAGVVRPHVSSLEDTITFEAPISAVRKLLSVRFGVFENRETKQRVARAVGVEVLPASVAAHVEVVAGHRGFPVVARKKPAGAHNGEGSSSSGSTAGLVTPQVLYDVYNVSSFPSTPSGAANVQSFFQAQGQAVLASDLTSFCDKFLPASVQQKCSITKYIGDKDQGTAGIESSLDSEYITAAGHGQETWVWSYNSGDFCADLLRWAGDVLNMTTGTHPFVISMSYGSQLYPNYCGAKDAARLSKDIQMMGAMGISVIIASGDDGSGEYVSTGGLFPHYNNGHLEPAMPSTVPYATAVGATTFVSGTSGEEMAVTAFGSGGGFSYSYDVPSYQKAAQDAYFKAASGSLPPKSSYHKGGRGTPDVSALGWGFDIISGGSWTSVGGTSASTPTFAGFVTLLNNVRLQSNKTLGFLNPLFYQHADVFTDITVGNNDVYSDGMGWVCTKGWDPVTGLGTPNVGKLIELVKGLNAADATKRGR